MIVKAFENREDWIEARRGKITGTKLKDLIVKRGNGQKIGFYQLIADRLAIPDDGEMSALDRGVSLESEAIDKFKEETDKSLNTDLVLWVREDNENIAASPDAYTEDMKEAVEVKCLNSARHIEALVTNKVPKDHEDQVLQYFIVNEKLEKLYLAFYDPRLLTKQFFFIEVERDEEKVKAYLEQERKILKEVEKITNSLMEF